MAEFLRRLQQTRKRTDTYREPWATAWGGGPVSLGAREAGARRASRRGLGVVRQNAVHLRPSHGLNSGDVAPLGQPCPSGRSRGV